MYIGNINAPGADIRGNQDIAGALFEGLHYMGSMRLVFFAMNGQNVYADAFHGLGHSFGPYPRSYKYHHPAVRVFVDESFQKPAFVIHFNKGKAVIHIF